jgi:hypothetical protein
MNTIESTWHHLIATLIPYIRKSDYIYHLTDNMFGGKCQDEGTDTFCKFMTLVSAIYRSRSHDVEEVE